MSTQSVELPTSSAMSIALAVGKGVLAAMAIHIIYSIYQARDEIADAYREGLRKARAARDDPPWASRPPFTSSRKRSPYKVLGVERGASQAVIKKSYRQLVVQRHPDKHPENFQSALEQMIQINSAYEVLGCRAFPTWNVETPTVTAQPMPSQTVPIRQPGPQPTNSVMYYASGLTTYLESPVVLGSIALLVLLWLILREIFGWTRQRIAVDEARYMFYCSRGAIQLDTPEAQGIMSEVRDGIFGDVFGWGP